jgi:hypothetical protein
LLNPRTFSIRQTVLSATEMSNSSWIHCTKSRARQRHHIVHGQDRALLNRRHQPSLVGRRQLRRRR